MVERPQRGWYLDARDRWRSYRVLVDGERVGKLRVGGRLVTSVAAGRHTVQVRIDWTGSRTAHVFLHEGGEVVLKVHPAGSACDIWQVVGNDKWLTLRVAVDD